MENNDGKRGEENSTLSSIAWAGEEDYRYKMYLVGRNFCVQQFLELKKIGYFAGINFQEFRAYLFS